jgi:hypothetical protein
MTDTTKPRLMRIEGPYAWACVGHCEVGYGTSMPDAYEDWGCAVMRRQVRIAVMRMAHDAEAESSAGMRVH